MSDPTPTPDPIPVNGNYELLSQFLVPFVVFCFVLLVSLVFTWIGSVFFATTGC